MLSPGWPRVPDQITSTPECRALVVLLAFPGSTGPILTAVRKAGVPTPLHCHPCLPIQHLPQPACPQLYSLPSKCTTHATWTSLSLPESVGTVAAAGAGLRSHASPLVACGELGQPSPAGGCLSSASGFPWGQFWGFPLMLLLSWGKQELGPPWGDMKGPLGPPHSACLCATPLWVWSKGTFGRDSPLRRPLEA